MDVHGTKWLLLSKLELLNKLAFRLPWKMETSVEMIVDGNFHGSRCSYRMKYFYGYFHRSKWKLINFHVSKTCFHGSSWKLPWKLAYLHGSRWKLLWKLMETSKQVVSKTKKEWKTAGATTEAQQQYCSSTSLRPKYLLTVVTPQLSQQRKLLRKGGSLLGIKVQGVRTAVGRGGRRVCYI